MTRARILADYVSSGDELALKAPLASPTFTGTVSGIPTFDDTAIRQDIITLALKEGIAENSTKFNLANSSVVQFQADADFNLAGSTTVTRNVSEYITPLVTTDTDTKFLFQPDETNGSSTMTDTSASGRTITNTGSMTHNTTIAKFSASSVLQDDTDGGKGLKFPVHSDFDVGTGVFTIDAWVYSTNWSGFNQGDGKLWDGSGMHRFGFKSSGATMGGEGIGTSPSGTWNTHSMSNNAWHHIAWVKSSTSVFSLYVDGARLAQNTNVPTDRTFSPTSTTFIGIFDVPTMDGTEQVENVYLGGIRFSTVDRTVDSGDPMYISAGTSFSVPTAYYAISILNATGTALGTTNVPSSAVTKVSGVMLLKHAYGTNTLGTDVKVYFTANNSAWTEASSYTDAGTFSTGIKMIKLGKTTCTSGSDVRWKIVWANQAASSKEGHVYGIGLNY
jgi:hypothetical protein